MLAMRDPSALLAFYHRGIATTVLKEDRLFTAFQRLTNPRHQHGRERPVHHLTMLQILDIYDLDLGHLDALITLGQFHKTIFPGLGIVVGLHRRGCSTEQGLCSKHLSKDDSGRTGMITWHGILLLITGLMLFVDDHEAEVLER